MPYSLRYALFVLSFASGCAHSPRIPMPEECSPLPDVMVCTERTIQYPQAAGYLCFKPEEIEPFLEICGDRAGGK